MKKRYKHALVIGKFYPPHKGHHHLVETAITYSKNVTVIVMGSMYDTITVGERVTWLRLIHPHSNIQVLGVTCEIPTDYTSSNTWEAHVELMKTTLKLVKHQLPPIDVVFTSETYGEQLATMFNAQHHLVDLKRNTHPISGTQVRENLHASWTYLHKKVRGKLALRVIVVGAESTGTTTITKELHRRYRNEKPEHSKTRWVSEYGRKYTKQKLEKLKRNNPEATMNDLVWRREDFAYIAEGQILNENRAAEEGGPVLFCDTDAFATQLWELRYLHVKKKGKFKKTTSTQAYSVMKKQPPFSDENFPTRRLYLLTHHEGVPFVQDGYRDGEHIRENMTSWFSEALTYHNLPWVLLTGTLEERLTLAEVAISETLKKVHRFSDP